MISIDDKLISDEIVNEHFVCDLSKCKGGCCVDGDAGAPLHDSELPIINEAVKEIWKDMYEEGREVVKKKSTYQYDSEFGNVTPLLKDSMCAYATKDDTGLIKCLFEMAYNEGRIKWKKPISCHLYPIKITETKHGDLLNYEPRDVMCKGGCDLGKKLKVPAYQFLKEPLVRKYGEQFYEDLDATAQYMKSK